MGDEYQLQRMQAERLPSVVELARASSIVERGIADAERLYNRRRLPPITKDIYYLAGLAWLTGQSVPQSDAEAAAAFQKAAEMGHSDAQYLLGALLCRSKSVPLDHKQASVWFAKAAEAGHSDAQLLNGALYAAGLGVERDPEAAYFWMTLGRSRGANLSTDLQDTYISVSNELGSAKKQQIEQKVERWSAIEALG